MNRLTLIATLLLLVFSVGCRTGTAGSIKNRLTHDKGNALMVTDEEAVVIRSATDLRQIESISAQVLFIHIGGLDVPAVCTGLIEEDCARFRDHDPVWINKAVWKSGRLNISELLNIPALTFGDDGASEIEEILGEPIPITYLEILEIRRD